MLILKLFLLFLVIRGIALFFEKNKYPSWMSPKLKTTFNRLKIKVKELKKLEKKALKKGHPDIAAEIRRDYESIEYMIHGVQHPGGSTESRMQQEISDLERRVRNAEWEARSRRW